MKRPVNENPAEKPGLNTVFLLRTGIVFLVFCLLIIYMLNRELKQCAVQDAEKRAFQILDHNLAIHGYFNQILRPKLLDLTSDYLSDRFFDPAWMSSTYAVREIKKRTPWFQTENCYYNETAVNARNPENEADEFEKNFLDNLNKGGGVTSQTIVREIEGVPHLQVIKKGEVLEKSCLQCHSTPEKAPAGLVDIYGPVRSFHRRVGEVVSAVSIRIPLAAPYGKADALSLKIGLYLIFLMGILFLILHFINKKYVIHPIQNLLNIPRSFSQNRSTAPIPVPLPLSREMAGLTSEMNRMMERIHQKNLELKTLNDKSENIIRSMQDGLIVFSPKGRVVSANDAALKLLEYSETGLIGKSLDDIFSASEKPDQHTMLNQEIDTPTLFPHKERTVLASDGSKIPVLLSGSVLRDSTGGITGTLCVFHDISNLKLYDEALKESEAKWRSITENSPDYIMLLDTDAGIMYANKPLPGVPLKEIIGQPVFNFLPSRFIQDSKNAIQDVRKTRKPVQHEVVFESKSGSQKFFSVRVGPVFDGPDIVAFISTSTDITEQRKTQLRLLKTERLASIGQLSAGVAHEINNPATFIHLNAHSMLKLWEKASPEIEKVTHPEENSDIASETLSEFLSKMPKLIHSVLKGIKRVSNITEALREFASENKPEKESIDLNEVIENAILMTESNCKNLAKLSYSSGTGPVMILGSSQKIEQTIINLIMNAAYAVQERKSSASSKENRYSGRISITTRPSKTFARMVEILIRDNGIGMDESTLGKIFEPFYTTKPPGRGSGLGMAIVYGIIKDHDGMIQVKSQKEEGTEIRILLPVMEEASENGAS